jgi:hypothetical protein
MFHSTVLAVEEHKFIMIVLLRPLSKGFKANPRERQRLT